MGKYGGKVLTVYITPLGVRVAEGENKNGSPYVSKFFVVPGVEQYFTEIMGDPGSYEITNIAELVETIVTECKNRFISTRRVMLCSNCFGINTVVATEPAGGGISAMLTGDLFAKKKDKDKTPKEKTAPDKMDCKIVWGTMVTDGVVNKKITKSTGDKFMLKSLVQEFYHRGYDVISLSDNIGILMNFRHTEEATFDSQGKVVLDFDTNIHVLIMSKDLPVQIDKYAPMTEMEILDRVENLIVSAQDIVGRNPKVYLTGALFSNTSLYIKLLDMLEETDCTVYDMFDRPETDPNTGLDPDSGLPVFTPDFSENIAMFMSAFAKDIVNILPKIEFSEIIKKNSKVLAIIFLLISTVVLLGSTFFAARRFFTLQDINNNPAQVSTLESQIQNLQSTQSSLNSTIETLTQADVTVLDLMNFIESHEDEFVTIVSVDTLDMLPSSISVSSSSTTITDSTEGIVTDSSADSSEVIDEGSTGINSTREAIIVRGYARSGPDAVSYYDSLFNSGLIVDPVLNGIEKYELPDGEEVYIFEIQIGG